MVIVNLKRQVQGVPQIPNLGEERESQYDLEENDKVINEDLILPADHPSFLADALNGT